MIIQNNVASNEGGFIFSINSIITTVGICHFQYNQAEIGGVFFLDNTNLTFIDSSHNSEYNGKKKENNYNISTIQPTIFYYNIVSIAGGVLFARHSNITIQSSCYTISHNEAAMGGAFYILNTILTLVGNMDHTGPIMIENNVATDDGGVIYALHDSMVQTSLGSFVMKNNRANIYGGIILADSSILFLEQCNMYNNMA
jgi:predicted outer membrane repeat protein